MKRIFEYVKYNAGEWVAPAISGLAGAFIGLAIAHVLGLL